MALMMSEMTTNWRQNDNNVKVTVKAAKRRQ